MCVPPLLAAQLDAVGGDMRGVPALRGQVAVRRLRGRLLRSMLHQRPPTWHESESRMIKTTKTQYLSSLPAFWAGIFPDVLPFIALVSPLTYPRPVTGILCRFPLPYLIVNHRRRGKQY